MIDFTPKNNIEAEESLIASLFIDNKEFDNCIDLLPEDFYKASHQKIFSAIISLINKGETADLTTIGHHLDNNNELESIGGGYCLIKIADTAPLSLNVKQHANIIKDCSLSRNILKTALHVVDMCREKTSTATALEYAQSEFLQIESKEIAETIHKVSDVIGSHLDRIEKSNTKKEGGGIPIGIPVIDRRLKVKEGKLIIIAGRPGMGKTSLAATIAHNMDRQGIKTGILSIEVPESDILDKFLAIESGVDTSKFDEYKGLSPEDYENLVVGCSILSRSEIMIDATGNINCSQVAQRARKMVKEGIKVLFIDQLSQIKGMNSTENKDRFARYAENVNRIALLKKELNIPIFLLAQLNRKIEQRLDKEPMLSDLKMSGDIEEDADSVLFLYRPGMYENTKDLSDDERFIIESKTILHLAKNRRGGTVRTDRVHFNNKTQYFSAKEY